MILQQNFITTYSSKYELLYLYLIKEFYKPINNIAYNLEDWLQFESRIDICRNEITAAETYPSFSDTNKQIMLSLY
jgi:hypothetical protein